MNRTLYMLLAFLATATLAQAQVLRTFTPRYSNASVRGNIVFVANNILTSSGGTTTEAPPGGTSSNNSRAGVNIDVDASPPGTPYLAYGASWKYLDNNTRPAGWEGAAFDDATWASGNAELGYGDGDEATIVSFGPSSTTKYPTTYFRRQVTIPNVSAHQFYRLDIEYDDGYVIYINGVEAARGNMPTGAVAHTTYASSAIEDIVATHMIPASFFTSGTNTIAVEIHQANAGSSDLSFNLRLEGSNDETFNSSSANLSLSACSQVLWAGLYWGATQGSSGTNMSWITGENTVKLRVPGASGYTNVTASQVDYHNATLVPGLPHTGYRSFADITSLIDVNNINGTYFVANVASPAGINNSSAGWTIVVVFANPSEIPRNLTVFDGSAIMDGGTPAMDVTLSGFLTPPSGPVSCELGAIVFDGDRTSQDEFSFRQSTVATFTNLTPNATSNTNDMWNSTISYKGNVVTARNPAHQNTLGYDADIILLPNASNAVLGNNRTSATVRFGSPSENYFVQVLTTSISVFNPSFNLAKSATDVNGGSLNPGEVIRYQLDYSNVGNDNSTASRIVDNIPANTGYKPGSLRINGVAKTDAAGDDEAEYDFANNRVIFRIGASASSSNGGDVATSGSGTVDFEVYAPTSCAVLACNNIITNSARMEYTGQTSGQVLVDSSGYFVSGCFTRGPVSISVSGTCAPRNDTALVNQCPATSVQLPVSLYGGFTFYTGLPFGPATAFDPSTSITTSRTLYAWYDGTGSCDDTIRINVFVNQCPDLDDDNDGIPDVVEGGGIDPSADADGDGTPNFLDQDFPGFADSNNDGVNDAFDADGDGIPNHQDLDSDNDGIPDVVESGGVDANGDGRIDDYTDPDNDGLSQNVDASNTGEAGSGNGLGIPDLDGDGIPNYLDLDSDNDGVPDVQEAYGADSNNDGRIDNFTDTDADGLADAVDGDVGNDGTAENSAAARLRTGSDNNNDGRADSYPFLNLDGDTSANPYDLDSDGDGIADVIEARLTDANFDGLADGAINAQGRSATVAALPSLTLSNRDGSGRPDLYDIDADDDGIPDNVEGLPTAFYLFPSYLDSDGDGIDDAYDTIVGFGGRGISVSNIDGDAFPDYIDFDTDGDGAPDIVEGNDFNFNRIQDDNVTLTGVDTDGDGLDDRFDSDNSSARGTSAYMGNGGTTSGDVAPGSITVVQRSHATFSDRDWRIVEYILNCSYVSFRAVKKGSAAQLSWSVVCEQEVREFIVERSLNGRDFHYLKTIPGQRTIGRVETYATPDTLTSIQASRIYYRLKAIAANSQPKYSAVVFVQQDGATELQVQPNPVRSNATVQFYAFRSEGVTIELTDATGRTVYLAQQRISAGSNQLPLSGAMALAPGVYHLRVSGQQWTAQTRFVKE
jgi:uncharacterized repeat protein (TIGR01451 family)